MKIFQLIQKWLSDKSRLMFRLKGTVILDIWPQIIFVSLYTTAVVCVHKYVPGMAMEFTPTLVPILGLVIGLLLVFRTNTAYDRYYEGRRIWSTMTNNIRILSRFFWIGGKKKDDKDKDKEVKKDTEVDPEDTKSEEDRKDEAEKKAKEEATAKAKDLIERTTAMNLLIAFAFATKNYLREEYSYEADDDITELINHVPRFTSLPVFKQPEAETASFDTSNPNGIRKVTIKMEDEADNEPNSPDELNNPKRRSRQPKSMSTRRRTALATRESETTTFTRRDSVFHAHDYVKPTNIPLELCYYIDSYCAKFGLDFGVFQVNNLMECLTQFERILRTPMPLAYSVHLHHALWLYLLALPFQLVNTLGWFTIALIALVTFALLGILAIGWEIENPFGYDDNDLPLDDFCEVIRHEIQMIMSHEVLATDTWTFTANNKPFIPKSYAAATNLQEKSVEELRMILATGCQDSLYRLDC